MTPAFIHLPSQADRARALDRRTKIAAGEPGGGESPSTSAAVAFPTASPAAYTFVRLGEAVVAVRRAA